MPSTDDDPPERKDEQAVEAIGIFTICGIAALWGSCLLFNWDGLSMVPVLFLLLGIVAFCYVGYFIVSMWRR